MKVEIRKLGEKEWLLKLIDKSDKNIDDFVEFCRDMRDEDDRS